MEAVGFLMMAHMLEPAELLEQARIMEDAGADCVYVVDSAGAMTTEDARARVAAAEGGAAPRPTQVGVHAHNNLSLAVANSHRGARGGRRPGRRLLPGPGRGCGQLPDRGAGRRLGEARLRRPASTRCAIMDVAEDVVRADDAARAGHRSRRADARLRGRLLELPAPRRAGRRAVRGRFARDPPRARTPRGSSAGRRT